MLSTEHTILQGLPMRVHLCPVCPAIPKYISFGDSPGEQNRGRSCVSPI